MEGEHEIGCEHLRCLELQQDQTSVAFGIDQLRIQEESLKKHQAKKRKYNQSSLYPGFVFPSDPKGPAHLAHMDDFEPWPVVHSPPTKRTRMEEVEWILSEDVDEEKETDEQTEEQNEEKAEEEEGETLEVEPYHVNLTEEEIFSFVVW
jgi:hypothetical protein